MSFVHGDRVVYHFDSANVAVKNYTQTTGINWNYARQIWVYDYPNWGKTISSELITLKTACSIEFYGCGDSITDRVSFLALVSRKLKVLFETFLLSLCWNYQMYFCIHCPAFPYSATFISLSSS